MGTWCFIVLKIKRSRTRLCFLTPYLAMIQSIAWWWAWSIMLRRRIELGFGLGNGLKHAKVNLGSKGTWWQIHAKARMVDENPMALFVCSFPVHFLQSRTIVCSSDQMLIYPSKSTRAINFVYRFLSPVLRSWILTSWCALNLVHVFWENKIFGYLVLCNSESLSWQNDHCSKLLPPCSRLGGD